VNPVPSATVATLRHLTDQPFELLLAMEQRALAAAPTAGITAAADEWVGVAFRLGTETFLAAREDTREVLAVPPKLTRVPWARSWVRGLHNVRGQLLPIIDLRQFLGGGVTPVQRQTRVLVVQHREVPAGLLVDEVLGFRRFPAAAFSAEVPPTLLRCDHYLAGLYRREAEMWPVFALRRLVESPAFLMAAR
jgi:twitching motility protein PilI